MERPVRGGAALALIAALSIGLATALAASLAGQASRLSRDRASDRALALAREALIAHAAARALDPVVGPGYLPCPDRDGDGWAESTCGSQDGSTGQSQRLGRLPWKTLAIAEPFDGHGEPLWYAVSSKHKGLLNCAPNAACMDMGPDSALGTISVRDAGGALVYDGRIADASRAGAGGAVAVIFAPGPPLERLEDVAGVGRRAQARGCTDACDAADFLDKAPGPLHGDEDNADFIDRNDAAGRGANGNGFIRGPVWLADGRLAVNDRLAAVGYDDLMPRVLQRVAEEIAHCIAKLPHLPAPVPACRTGPPVGQPGTRFGRVPQGSFAACAIFEGAGPGWWTAWRDNVFYAVDVQPVDALGNSLGSRARFAILVAGPPLPGQSRADAAVVDGWLEGPHRSLAALNPPPPPDCAPAPATACPAGTCDRVALAPRGLAFNDVVAARR